MGDTRWFVTTKNGTILYTGVPGTKDEPLTEMHAEQLAAEANIRADALGTGTSYEAIPMGERIA